MKSSVYRRYAITSAADLAEGVAKLAVLHGVDAEFAERRSDREKHHSSTIGRLISTGASRNELSK